MFPFEIGTLAYQELGRSRSWRFGRTPRFGAREASQYLGPGDDQVTLSGAIIPGLSGAFWSIEKLAQMADEGLAWPLVSGVGSVLGHYVVDSLEHRESTFLVDGLPRKGDFTLTLHRVADDAQQQQAIGGLTAFNPLEAAGAALELDVPTVATRIQQGLASSNMSLSALAGAAGVPLQQLEGLVSAASSLPSTIARLATPPSLSAQQLELVAQALDVSPDWLTGAVDAGFANG
jgi:phage protein U